MPRSALPPLRAPRHAGTRAVRRALAATVAVTVAAALTACSGDVPTRPTAHEPRLATAVANDPLVLAQAGTVTLTIASTECAAVGNVITLTSPVRDVLTTDACYDAGATRTYGPFPAGAEISIDFFAALLGRVVGPDFVRVTGSYPQWTILYEDFDDFDFNDVELAVVVTVNGAPRVDRLHAAVLPPGILTGPDGNSLSGVWLRARLRDPGDTGPWDWRIDWGDGVVTTPENVARKGEFVFLRPALYTTPGPQTITVTATDPAGNESAPATTTVGSGATVRFRDDFDDNTLDGWTPLTGTWRVADGRMLGTGHGGDIDGFVDLVAAGPFTEPTAVDVDVDMITGNAEIVLSSTGGRLINGYRVTLWAGTSPVYGNRYSITRYENGAAVGLHVSDPAGDGNALSPIPIPAQVHVTVRRVGPQITVDLDGRRMASVADPDPLPPVGRVGLGVIWDMTAAFDNVVVRTP